jgi:hypothetical protein
MNASVVQKVNLAPMSVEEMENINGGVDPITTFIVSALLVSYISYVFTEASASAQAASGFNAGYNAGNNAAKP